MNRVQSEALDRATHNASLANYPAIFAGFMNKGISEENILPRENVFTFQAWKALGRSVCKGEHGVKVDTWITCKRKEVNEETGEPVTFRRPKTTTVFHVTQTKETGS